jgi:hypothetical protein
VLLRTIAACLFLLLPSLCLAQLPPQLAIFLKFDSKPSPVFLKNMEGELGTILAPAGLDLRWYLSPDQGETGDSWLRTISISFHGACTAFPAANTKAIISRRINLADTEVSGGKVIPYSDINCDGVRTFIDEGKQRHPGEEARLGVAAARILAHELYHVLLQTSIHSKTGIAEAVYTPATLLARSLHFEQGELEKICSRLSLPSIHTFKKQASKPAE